MLPFLLLCLLLPGEESSSKDRRDRYPIAATESAVKVDGVLDEEAWKKATRIPLNIEYYPGDNVAPPVDTEALVTYDSRNFYVAFRCSDPKPQAIRAHLMNRDNIATFVQDDHVGFLIDTFNDERRAFQFRINPLGVQVDALFSEAEGVEDFSWDAIWDSAGKITDEGYIVEVSVPLRQLRFPEGGPQTWTMETFRSYPREFRHRISNSIRDRDVNCLICQMDKIENLQGLSPGNNLQITPTLTSSRSDNRPIGGDWQEGDEDNEGGLTMRWGVNSNTTLTAAYNPDFSQVEADVAQLQVNTRFALFFPEKRPFFLESIDTFATPINAVFTRTVVDPETAVKLSGKSGKHTYGLFLAQDEVNNILLPSNQGTGFATLPGEVESGVFRYRRDVGRNSTVGALLTSRQGDNGYSNTAMGVDGFFRLSQKDTVQFQYLHTETDYPETLSDRVNETEVDGSGILAGYTHQVRKWKATATYRDLGKGFRVDSGFVPRVDIRELETGLERSIWGKPKGFYSLINLGLNAARIEDQDGSLSDERVEIYANLDGTRQSFAEVKFGSYKERYLDTVYDMDRTEIFLQTQPYSKLKFTLWSRFGDTVDYGNAAAADLMEWDAAMEMKLGRGFNLQVSNTRREVDVAEGWLLDENLFQLRAVYNFNLRTFVRLVSQYRDVSSNQDLISYPVDAESENLFNQLLLSYKVNPQTVCLLGYSDNQIGTELIDLNRNNRTFFLKLGYAWLR